MLSTHADCHELWYQHLSVKFSSNICCFKTPLECIAEARGSWCNLVQCLCHASSPGCVSGCRGVCATNCSVSMHIMWLHAAVWGLPRSSGHVFSVHGSVYSSLVMELAFGPPKSYQSWLYVPLTCSSTYMCTCCMHLSICALVTYMCTCCMHVSMWACVHLLRACEQLRRHFPTFCLTLRLLSQ